MANERFQNALQRKTQNIPPIWMMRQAGRYHWHYQKLKEKYTFMELCKNPDLASEVALGPVQDFDFDLAILFSDILFPLEGLGMGLEYTDHGPRLGWHITDNASMSKFRSMEDAVEFLQFQGQAVRLTREKLPADKSLIGFVGGAWTLFTYAVVGKHEGSLSQAKKLIQEQQQFFQLINRVLAENIRIQLEAGAELVMVFDTAGGELCPMMFEQVVIPAVQELVSQFPGRVGYYTKNSGMYHIDSFRGMEGLAGFGIDHKQYMPDFLKARQKGFVQGNFDQSLLFQEEGDFIKSLDRYLQPILELSAQERAGWVAGLGHGVLPKTPQQNVRKFVEHVREVFA